MIRVQTGFSRSYPASYQLFGSGRFACGDELDERMRRGFEETQAMI